MSARKIDSLPRTLGAQTVFGTAWSDRQYMDAFRGFRSEVLRCLASGEHQFQWALEWGSLQQPKRGSRSQGLLLKVGQKLWVIVSDLANDVLARFDSKQADVEFLVTKALGVGNHFSMRVLIRISQVGVDAFHKEI